MASYYSELLTYLKTQSAITDEVGAASAARIYPDAAREGAALPYLVIVETGGGVSYEHLGGISGVAETVWSIYSYADDRAEANDLAELVRLALQTYRGTMGSTLARVSAAITPDTGVDLPRDASDQKRFWARTVYRIHFDQATA